MKLRARGSSRPALAPTVAVAFCDLAGAGPRALMALEPPAGCTMSATELDVEGLPSAERAFVTAQRTAPVELFTFSDADGTPRTSLLVLLAPVAEAHQTSVAAALYEFVSAPQQHGALSRLVVVAAMRFRGLHAERVDVCAVALNGASAAGLPALPADTVLSDGLLASLLHFCRAGGTPTLALLAPGFRVRLPGSAVDDEAVAVARRLAASACAVLGCSFSPDAAKLRAKLVAWNSADADASVMYV